MNTGLDAPISLDDVSGSATPVSLLPLVDLCDDPRSASGATQLDRALRRVTTERAIDPQAAVACFSSAF